LEFLVEANSIARRHPVFVTITNVAAYPPTKKECANDPGKSYCAGHTALFGNLRADPKDCPNCIHAVTQDLPSIFLTGNNRSVPYDSIVADVPPLNESLLVYELNLRLLREPAATNAPDQGYPPIRSIHRVQLP
jgi:hypothetical protein